jgi:endonuclease/exonuclease/phosphatase family metal-dependent hydrolase
MRVVTWNIHGCVGSRQQFDPHGTTRVLQRLRPDVVALQEVDARSERALGFDSFAHFADHGGGYAAEARTITSEDGDYGHMVISRWPIRMQTVHDISHAVHEPRKVIDAYIERKGHVLRVLAAHFGLNLRERRAQIEALMEIIGRDGTTPTLLLGDFNQVRRRGRLHKALSPDFGCVAVPATFPAKRPFFPLDRVWGRPSNLIETTSVYREAAHASDHLPLVAELNWAEHATDARLRASGADTGEDGAAFVWEHENE